MQLFECLRTLGEGALALNSSGGDVISDTVISVARISRKVFEAPVSVEIRDSSECSIIATCSWEELCARAKSVCADLRDLLGADSLVAGVTSSKAAYEIDFEVRCDQGGRVSIWLVAYQASGDADLANADLPGLVNSSAESHPDVPGPPERERLMAGVLETVVSCIEAAVRGENSDDQGSAQPEDCESVEVALATDAVASANDAVISHATQKALKGIAFRVRPEATQVWHSTGMYTIPPCRPVTTEDPAAAPKEGVAFVDCVMDSACRVRFLGTRATDMAIIDAHLEIQLREALLTAQLTRQQVKVRLQPVEARSRCGPRYIVVAVDIIEDGNGQKEPPKA